MAKLCIFIATLCALQVLTQADDNWETFKQKHGKRFSSNSTEGARRANFEARKSSIDKHNQEASKGKHNYTQGLNEYSDLSPEELARMNGFKPGNHSDGRPFIQSRAAVVPASIDWRSQGYVTAVKNQGQCGSCWTFAATGALEGQRKRTTGTLVSLSEQQLVDCDSYDGGCNGGWPGNAFIYVGNNRGINYEATYPYQAVKGSCRYSSAPSNIGATCAASYSYTTPGDENALKTVVGTIGPVSVAIQVTNNFQNYRSGVFYDPTCATGSNAGNYINHAVLVVGYGTASGSDYWIVKNSWGTSWGEAGYIRMARNRGDNCGIALYVQFPTSVTSGMYLVPFDIGFR